MYNVCWEFWQDITSNVTCAVLLTFDGDFIKLLNFSNGAYLQHQSTSNVRWSIRAGEHKVVYKPLSCTNDIIINFSSSFQWKIWPLLVCKRITVCQVLDYLLWASMCMETSLPLISVKYLPWRSTLYAAVCQCYSDCKRSHMSEVQALNTRGF